MLNLQNEKGIAVFESIPIMMVLIVLLNFSIGFFGVVHSGILNSIAARNYAFETLRHRTDYRYFRAEKLSTSSTPYHKVGYRFHGTIGETEVGRAISTFIATTRTIDFFNIRGSSRVEFQGEGSAHTQQTNTVVEGARNTEVAVNPVWIKTKYGICLNLSCGGKE